MCIYIYVYVCLSLSIYIYTHSIYTYIIHNTTNTNNDSYVSIVIHGHVPTCRPCTHGGAYTTCIDTRMHSMHALLAVMK